VQRIKKSGIITASVILLLFALLIVSAVWNSGSYALTSVIFIILMLVPFYFSFETRRPQARELVIIAVLSAVAALGRVIFAALPDVKPISAIVIISGIALGPQAGFITGATSAIASNIFFGQGPYTPWQMFSWGMMGFCAGLLSKAGFLRRRFSICVFGFVWGFIFGWIMDLWQVLGFVNPIDAKSVLLSFTASFYFDLIHAVSNVVFLLLIAIPWLKILSRVKIKYGLMEEKL
jgi:energy-coupling factor transport system substrate-specific component